MPFGILGSLIICTVLYVLVSGLLTGIKNYTTLMTPAPVADGAAAIGVHWGILVIDIGAIAGLASVMLVMLLGQSRVFFSMASDRLLPKVFRDVHPKFRTPWRCNLILMVFVSLFAAFAPISVVGKMTSIGTMFAFVIVCAGIIIMRRTNPDLPRPFRTPWVPLIPILGILVNLLLMAGLGWTNWLRLIVWMAIGFAVYFGYSRSRSLLNNR
jgi:APA family basic amino acid/polyamine antiporter